MTIVGLLASGLFLAHPRPTPTASQPYTWRNVQIVGGGFISGIDYHPAKRGVLYARTDIGGAYRWDPSHKSWVPLLDWLTKADWNLYGIESIGLDPSDANKLYLACGTYTQEWAGNGAVLRSNDQGRTFKRANLPFKLGGNEDGRSIGERLAVDPNDGKILFFGSRNNGLWRSGDGGATWAQVESFPIKDRTNGIGVGLVVFDPHSGSKGTATQTVYVGVESRTVNLYKSTDGGQSWTAVASQPTGFPHHAFLTKDAELYLTYGNGPGPNNVSDGAVWKLDTASGSWTDITPVKPHSSGEGGFGYAGLAVDRNHPQTVEVSTLDRWNPGDDVFRTTDGGKTWVGLRAKSERDASAAPYMTWGQKAASFGWWIGALALDPFNPSTTLYGTGANIWASEDVTAADQGQGTHWEVRAKGIEETASIDLLSPEVGPHLITAVGDIGGFTHDDLQVSPPKGMTKNPMLGNTDSLDAAGKEPEMIVRVGRAGGNSPHGGFSFDAGETWTAFPTEPTRRGSGSIAVSADAHTIVWAPQGSPPFFTKDRGVTWTASKGGHSGWVVSDRVDPSTFYVMGSNGALYFSKDAGASFDEEAKGLPSHDYMRAVFGHQGDLWLPCNNGLLHSTDGGVIFSKLPHVDSAQGVGFGKAAPGKSYPAIYLNGQIDGAAGVFRSDDAGESWIKISDPKHEYGTREMVIGDPRIYGRVYMGTNGRGVLYGDIAGASR